MSSAGRPNGSELVDSPLVVDPSGVNSSGVESTSFTLKKLECSKQAFA